jgi:hypothetical protein
MVACPGVAATPTKESRPDGESMGRSRVRSDQLPARLTKSPGGRELGFWSAHASMNAISRPSGSTAAPST